MICGLIGNIYKLEAMRVEFEVNGVIYDIALSVQTSAKLTMGEKYHLLITQIIREDCELLFGFLDRFERSSFERLLKINGVGPKVALAILSTFTPNDFAQIVNNKDLSALQKVPGVGAKSAGKILLDLAGFFDAIFQNEQNLDSSLDSAQTSAQKQEFMALESLGYKTNDIKKIMPKITAQETTAIIKEALNLLR